MEIKKGVISEDSVDPTTIKSNLLEALQVGGYVDAGKIAQAYLENVIQQQAETANPCMLFNTLNLGAKAASDHIAGHRGLFPGHFRPWEIANAVNAIIPVIETKFKKILQFEQ